eukprot:CAMPEP_0202448794 /NCGR_PEP_ID=MMETSP1360-20130828/7586_1 /ASSEMBLY_ACC=CAM_ASM_000848 /TAXON_ID=515479 /ORGANISM="Licmophora paradoxa, Strain CCMP2313" /LENGTH=99 /DNA_ID=CAMNT_0049066509 /DNA_START=115 /DNA_END=414 /DNA_ORIENTATION=+
MPTQRSKLRLPSPGLKFSAEMPQDSTTPSNNTWYPSPTEFDEEGINLLDSPFEIEDDTDPTPKVPVWTNNLPQILLTSLFMAPILYWYYKSREELGPEN